MHGLYSDLTIHLDWLNNPAQDGDTEKLEELSLYQRIFFSLAVNTGI